MTYSQEKDLFWPGFQFQAKPLQPKLQVQFTKYLGFISTF